MRTKRRFLLPLLMLSMFLGMEITASAETGVRWSETGEAWTTDYLNTSIEEVEPGTVISTGVTAQPVTVRKGQHIYTGNAAMSESIPIGHWDMTYPDHYGIYNRYPDDTCLIIYNNFQSYYLQKNFPHTIQTY